jgi:hypothetical protein
LMKYLRTSKPTALAKRPEFLSYSNEISILLGCNFCIDCAMRDGSNSRY